MSNFAQKKTIAVATAGGQQRTRNILYETNKNKKKTKLWAKTPIFQPSPLNNHVTIVT